MQLQILNSYHLKIFALCTMVIDHIGMIFFPQMGYFRIIGRIAFILYAFMLVEGFFYTKTFSKYVSKLVIWAIISEFVFDLVFHGKLIYLQEQNIFFTLLLGLTGMYFLQNATSLLRKLIISLLFISAALILRVDYSWYGVALIFTFYYFRNNNHLKFLIAQILSTTASFTLLIYQFFAFLGLIPIAMYNGRRGKKIGDIYYSFYAVHLSVLGVIKIMINS